MLPVRQSYHGSFNSSFHKPSMKTAVSYRNQMSMSLYRLPQFTVNKASHSSFRNSSNGNLSGSLSLSTNSHLPLSLPSCRQFSTPMQQDTDFRDSISDLPHQKQLEAIRAEKKRILEQHQGVWGLDQNKERPPESEDLLADFHKFAKDPNYPIPVSKRPKEMTIRQKIELTEEQQREKQELIQMAKEAGEMSESRRQEFLNPPTLQEQVVAKTKQAALKVPVMLQKAPAFVIKITAKIVSALKTGIVEFIKNPSVIFEWWSKLKQSTSGFLHHWVLGFKLLVGEVRLSMRILRRMLKGHALTRRESAQLRRTAADLFRVVPLSVFLIVPMLEFLLPFALKLFPNLLPSTFEDKLKKQEDVKKRLRAKLEVAKFLQETAVEMTDNLRKAADPETQATAEEFAEFIQRVRSGQPVKNEDLVKFGKLFKDDITLDALTRPQLVAMNKYMGLNVYGGNSLLRFQLLQKIRKLKADDRLIHWEGVNSLSYNELREACQSRGMRFTGLSVYGLRKQLQQWIDLSINQNIPPTLLILSRVLVMAGEDFKAEEMISTALSSMPDELVDEITLSNAADKNDEYIKKRLELLEKQERLIEEEQKEEEQREEKTHKEEGAEVSKLRTTTQAEKGPKVSEEEAEEEELSEEKLKEYTEAMAVMASSSPVTKELETLHSLEATHAKLVESEESQDKGLNRLDRKLTSMITQLKKDIDEADSEIGKDFNILDADKDGILSTEEISAVLRSMLREKPDDEQLEKIIDKLDTNRDGKVTVRELRDILEQAEKHIQRNRK